jgi:hypothetical protein
VKHRRLPNGSEALGAKRQPEHMRGTSKASAQEAEWNGAESNDLILNQEQSNEVRLMNPYILSTAKVGDAVDNRSDLGAIPNIGI